MPKAPPDPAGPHIHYRREIDGLRAVAVLGVMLCHGGFAWIEGGFLGVDIFFAVSGYLITAILLADLRDGSFSAARFYERRIRRIVPALLVMLLLATPLAIWTMLPADLVAYGNSLIATLLFANNLLLWGNTGYFGLEVNFMPLMHSWSLAVEEQYYLLVPLFMLFAWRIRRTAGITLGIASATIASLVLWILLSHFRPMTGFFLLPSRGWELGIGALAALGEPRLRPCLGPRLSAGVALGGMIAAVAPMFLIDLSGSPGIKAIVPVVGVAAILLFGNARGPAGRLLTVPPMIAIGRISYSVYLIHQPLFALVRLSGSEPPSHWTMTALVLLSLALGAVSWRFVEQPFRNRAMPAARVYLWCGAAGTVALALGLTLTLSGGFYRAWPAFADPALSARAATIAYNVASNRFVDQPLPADAAEPRLAVIGDSFARDFVSMARASIALDPHRITIITASTCAPLPASAATNLVRADFVVIANRFRASEVDCLVRRLKAVDSRTRACVIVLGTKSFGYNYPATALRRADYARTRIRPSANAVAANAAARAALPREAYVDTLAVLGAGQETVPVFTPDGYLFSTDQEHFTRAGAGRAGLLLFRTPPLRPLAEATRRGVVRSPG